MAGKELAELDRAIGEIWEAARRLGLDPYPTCFEVVPASIMYEFGAYGLPGRFSHWTGGKAYQAMKTRYDYGLAKIYELVINANPAQAFLLETNSLLAHKLVVAHVFAHSDFFKNNAYFRATAPDMVERATLHAERMRQHEFRYGRREVEAVLDAVLAIQEHVEMGLPRPMGKGAEGEACRDLLLFLLDHAPALEEWERDVIEMVRDERLYFTPQVQTKILNEGWATYWHIRIMRELDLSDAEYADFARLNADIQAPPITGLNPYLLGCRMLEDIERRSGPENGCRRLFEVREMEDDVSFFRNYLTREIIKSQDLYTFRYEQDAWRVADVSWEEVREAAILSRVHGGNPVIAALDADYRGNRELYLCHCFDGRELDREYAEKTLEMVRRLWRRRVHLETVVEGRRMVIVNTKN